MGVITRSLRATGLAVLCGLAPAAAQAVPVSFTCLTGSLPGDCAIGETQLQVEVSDLGSQVMFSLSNTGSEAAAVSEVYFDDGTLLGLASIANGPGVDFSQFPINPPDLPGGNLASPPFNVTAGFHANASNPPPMNGVGPGETLGIVFDLQAGGTFADVLAELGNGDLRIGLHVIGFASGGSESFINQAVPEPLAAASLLLALGALAVRRSVLGR